MKIPMDWNEHFDGANDTAVASITVVWNETHPRFSFAMMMRIDPADYFEDCFGATDDNDDWRCPGSFGPFTPSKLFSTLADDKIGAYCAGGEL